MEHPAKPTAARRSWPRGSIMGDPIRTVTSKRHSDGLNPDHAFSWTSAGGMVDLGSLGRDAFATAVNDSGQIAGYGYVDGGPRYAVTWRPFASLGCDTTLAGCNLKGVSLAGAYLKDGDLSDANLKGANLSRANLSGANLENANLKDANLTNANLTGARLRNIEMFANMEREHVLTRSGS